MLRRPGSAPANVRVVFKHGRVDVANLGHDNVIQQSRFCLSTFQNCFPDYRQFGLIFTVKNQSH